MKLVFRPEAAADLERGYIWYEDQRAGLGEELAAAVWQTIESVLANPRQYPIHRRQTRRAQVRRFPYTVLYRIAEGAVVVLGIFHARSNPKEWDSRA